MIVVYYFLNFLLAPGVVMHELGHAVCCVLARVKIYRIKLFGFSNPPGYVEHAEPEGFLQSLMISGGPLIVNSVCSLVFFSQISPPYFSIRVLLVGWLGAAIALHAIPSLEDTVVVWKSAKRKIIRNPFIILGLPFVLFLYVLNFLKRWHIHVVYAVGLAWLGAVYLK